MDQYITVLMPRTFIISIIRSFTGDLQQNRSLWLYIDNDWVERIKQVLISKCEHKYAQTHICTHRRVWNVKSSISLISLLPAQAHNITTNVIAAQRSRNLLVKYPRPFLCTYLQKHAIYPSSLLFAHSLARPTLSRSGGYCDNNYRIFIRFRFLQNFP